MDGELNRRLALYAAIIFDGSAAEKQAYFDQSKRHTAYVHGRYMAGGRHPSSYMTVTTPQVAYSWTYFADPSRSGAFRSRQNSTISQLPQRFASATE